MYSTILFNIVSLCLYFLDWMTCLILFVLAQSIVEEREAREHYKLKKKMLSSVIRTLTFRSGAGPVTNCGTGYLLCILSLKCELYSIVYNIVVIFFRCDCCSEMESAYGKRKTCVWSSISFAPAQWICCNWPGNEKCRLAGWRTYYLTRQGRKLVGSWSQNQKSHV